MSKIGKIKERLRYKCEQQQSPDCMVLDDQRLEYRVTIAEFLEFIRDHDRQAKKLTAADELRKVLEIIASKRNPGFTDKEVIRDHEILARAALAKKVTP